MNPLKPSSQLLCKIGSLIIHYQEWTSKDGRPVDRTAIKSLEDDPEVKQWIKQMDKLAFIPQKRIK